MLHTLVIPPHSDTEVRNLCNSLLEPACVPYVNDREISQFPSMDNGSPPPVAISRPVCKVCHPEQSGVS